MTAAELWEQYDRAEADRLEHNTQAEEAAARKYDAIWRLVYEQGIRQVDVAERLGCRPQWVGDMIRRARR